MADERDYYEVLGVQKGASDDEIKKAFKKMAQVFGYPNREYKDRVFRMLLKEPKVALEVYNAMNGTSYDNPDELIITTLENAVYLGMKNDVSFILGTQLVLYEHQSTPNPNMPLRNLAYVACVYMAYVFGDNLYGRKLIKIPEPRFVVFYNGQTRCRNRVFCVYQMLMKVNLKNWI